MRTINKCYFQWWLGWSSSHSRHPILRHFPLFQAWAPTDWGSLKNGLKQKIMYWLQREHWKQKIFHRGKGRRWKFVPLIVSCLMNSISIRCAFSQGFSSFATHFPFWWHHTSCSFLKILMLALNISVLFINSEAKC